MKTIRFQRKPVLIFAVLCLCTFVWLVYSVANKTSAGKKLRTTKREFNLHGKPFRILSGAIHYFRVVPEYWRDRLLKLKAMGLNTVETYVPWNLHEEIKGQISFEGILDIRKFIKTADELGLYVIVRPGPYICAEWDLGGLPSWLLHDPKAELRTMYPPFIHAVEKYFDELLPLLAPLQFSKDGPIIAFQVENEYGSYGQSSNYMQHLKRLMLRMGIKELLFTSDGIQQMEEENHYVLDVLKTVNFQKNETTNLQRLKKLQPDKPLMVMEYWSGWFDHWGEHHHVLAVEKTEARVTRILQMGASINFYMFHGGTNFGFMNGANGDEENRHYKPTITSYDYDAPLSEAGDITPKYKALRAAIKKTAPRDSMPRDFPRSIPPNPERKVYEAVEIQHYMPLTDLLRFVEPVKSVDVMAMEFLPINNNGGQGYGFTLYQTELHSLPKTIEISKVADRAQILLNSELVHTIDGMDKAKGYISKKALEKVTVHMRNRKIKGPINLEILVENMGRVNYMAMNKQRKGILGSVYVDGKKQTQWKIYPLEFKSDFMKKLKSKEGNWKQVREELLLGPNMYKGTFLVDDKPKDTFLNMNGWTKGVCFVNGHNLGRYWKIGPQETLYLPAPWLHTGDNEVMLFELHGLTGAGGPEVEFVAEPRLGHPAERHR